MTGTKPIRIEFLDKEQMRYATCGDYFEEKDRFVIQVCKQGDPKANLLIALHEFIEYALVTDRDIKEEDIMAFDLEWNKKFPYVKASEPGDEPGCPYRNQHRIAENFERQLATYLGVDWDLYEQNLEM
jgi:hypothetical protein